MMKLVKILFALILLLQFPIKGQSNNQNIHLNYNIFIDDEFVIDLCNGMFIIKDSIDTVSDSIPFRYEAGDLELSLDGYQKLLRLKSDSRVKFNISREKLNLKYYQTSIYFINIVQSWLINRYVIIKIYNYDNKRNHKFFRERKGYGVEIYSPPFGLVLARK